MKKRRTYSREYKLEAVKKVVLQGLPYREVARYLGIRDNLIHNWRKQLESDGALAKLTNNNATAEAEFKRLRDEVRQLKMERDILTKAASNTPQAGSLNKEFELRLAPTSFNAHSTNHLTPASHSNQ